MAGRTPGWSRPRPRVEDREVGHTHKHTTRTAQHTTRQEQHHTRPLEEPPPALNNDRRWVKGTLQPRDGHIVRAGVSVGVLVVAVAANETAVRAWLAEFLAGADPDLELKPQYRGFGFGLEG